MSRLREKRRDDRDFDTTQLRAEAVAGKSMSRDYSAHFFRWSFARRFIKAEHKVLEVGCGQDTPLMKILTLPMVRQVHTYVGVDMNKLKPIGTHDIHLVGEFNFVERWKELKRYAPKGFDVAVHLEVIEHMHSRFAKPFLRGMLQLLKPGGVMIMSTPCYDGKRHAANHIREYTVHELQKITESVGFKVERRFGTFMDIKYIGRELPHSPEVFEKNTAVELRDAVTMVCRALEPYFEGHAISNIFGPLYPDHARNN
jgi:2-polyprenyl-3-methyl-5-hydroxy-6-metoxy-1,4-benzoquinol methylase